MIIALWIWRVVAVIVVIIVVFLPPRTLCATTRARFWSIGLLGKSRAGLARAGAGAGENRRHCSWRTASIGRWCLCVDLERSKGWRLCGDQHDDGEEEPVDGRWWWLVGHVIEQYAWTDLSCSSAPERAKNPTLTKDTERWMYFYNRIYGFQNDPLIAGGGVWTHSKALKPGADRLWSNQNCQQTRAWSRRYSPLSGLVYVVWDKKIDGYFTEWMAPK